MRQGGKVADTLIYRLLTREPIECTETRQTARLLTAVRNYKNIE
jgi:hypothetical protein